MPNRLKARQKKIQNKRKQTPWREFVMEIASWQQFTFHKDGEGRVSRYPSERVKNTIEAGDFELSSDENLGDYIYDFDRGFFGQWWDHFQSQKLPRLWQIQPYENCDYADTAGSGAKNIYLTTTAAFNVENVMYSYEIAGFSSNVYNSVMAVNHSDVVYQSAMVVNSFRVFYSSAISDSSDIWFSHNLQGCTHCIGCFDLQNQSYCIQNVSYTKDEYEIRKYALMKKKDKFDQYVQAICTKSSRENFIQHSDDVDGGIFVSYTHHARNVAFSSRDESESKEFLCDVFSTSSSLVHAYGCMGVSPGEHMYMTMNSAGAQLYYSYYLINCSYCLGCIGLKNKSYCIFNKQYTKEERYDKVDEIFTQMEKDGDLGKFFPGSMNPFYFNDTAAYLIDDSFTKEEVEAKGYLRRDNPITVDIPEWMDVVDVKDLDTYEGYDQDNNRTIDPSILKKVIKDEQGNVYRIIKMEYDFLIKHGLPLPRKHWLERLKNHFQVT